MKAILGICFSRTQVVSVPIHLINTSLQRGVMGHETSASALAVYCTTSKTAKAVPGRHHGTVTPLKRGVNERPLASRGTGCGIRRLIRQVTPPAAERHLLPGSAGALLRFSRGYLVLGCWFYSRPAAAV